MIQHYAHLYRQTSADSVKIGYKRDFLLSETSIRKTTKTKGKDDERLQNESCRRSIDYNITG